MGSPLHSPGSWYAHDFVCALQEWSLCSSDSLGLPKLFPGWPGWDVWRGAQNLYNSGTTSLITAVLLLWVAHLAIWDIILLWLCPSFCLIAASPLSLDVGFFFFFFDGFQSPLVDGCWTASCDFGALKGGGECRFFYSAILNQYSIFYLNWNIPIKLSINS